MRELDTQDDCPEQDADAGCCRSDIFNNLDLVILVGFDEVAQGLDGAVHDLRDQHQGGDDDDQRNISRSGQHP